MGEAEGGPLSPVAGMGCREAVQEALASVRAEGLEPGSECLTMLEAIGAGTLSEDQAIARLLDHYQQ